MMKVTVKDNFLNVRVGTPSVNAPCYQYLAPGSEIEIDGQLYKGDKFGPDGIDTWMKDLGGNYYWSGGILKNEPSLQTLRTDFNNKISFRWFKSLRIHNVWEKFKEKGDSAIVAILDTGYVLKNVEINSKTTSAVIIDEGQYSGEPLIKDDESSEAHGNRCASLIGAANTGNHIVGIAPECKLLSAKISRFTELRDFNYIIKGIAWAISNGADIISISFADRRLNSEQVEFFENEIGNLLRDKNVIIFCASGNSGKAADMYPASFHNCISVGASNYENQISSITTLSDTTIIHAPGESIEAYDNKNIPTPAHGTSYSTPIVAGISALAVSYIKKKNNGTWDTKALLSLIYSTGIPLTGSNNKKIIDPLTLFNNL